jgi:hypothetical protein
MRAYENYILEHDLEDYKPAHSMLKDHRQLQDHLKVLHLLKTQGLAPFAKTKNNKEYELLEEIKKYW